MTDIVNSTGWIRKIIFKLGSNQNNRFRVGLANQASSSTPTNFVGLRADSNASWENATTPNFVLCACNQSVKTGWADLDLGVPVDANYHRLGMTSAGAGTIKVIFDNQSEKTICAAGSSTLNATGKLAVQDLQLGIMSGQEGSTPKTATVDRILLGWTGRNYRW